MWTEPPQCPSLKGRAPGLRVCWTSQLRSQLESRGGRRRRAPQALLMESPWAPYSSKLGSCLVITNCNYAGGAWAQRQVTYLSAKHTTALTRTSRPWPPLNTLPHPRHLLNFDSVGNDLGLSGRRVKGKTWTGGRRRPRGFTR